MKIQRTLPTTAAAKIPLKNFLHGFIGMVRPKKYINKVETELKNFFDVKHVFLLSSGKAALTIILNALKKLNPDKNEVIIPAYTCFSVPSAVIKSSLKPSVCDIDPRTFNIDPSLLAKSFTDNTLCVVTNHLFGAPSEMDTILNICKEKSIYVVEDAAQAMGGYYHDKKLGTIGDVGFFSLGRGKNLTCGSGGIILTNSEKLAEAITNEYLPLENLGYPAMIGEFLKILSLNIFIYPSLYWFPAGLSFLKLGETIFYSDFPIRKLSGLQAGFLNYWKERLIESNHARIQLAQWFIDALGVEDQYKKNIPYLRFPILAENHLTRDMFLLKAKKLGVSLMYPVPVNEIPEIRGIFDDTRYPNAKDIAERILTFPTHRLVSSKDKEKLVLLYLQNFLTH